MARSRRRYSPRKGVEAHGISQAEKFVQGAWTRHSLICLSVRLSTDGGIHGSPLPGVCLDCLFSGTANLSGASNGLHGCFRSLRGILNPANLKLCRVAGRSLRANLKLGGHPEEDA